jgi:hypothetical protein
MQTEATVTHSKAREALARFAAKGILATAREQFPGMTDRYAFAATTAENTWLRHAVHGLADDGHIPPLRLPGSGTDRFARFRSWDDVAAELRVLAGEER